MNFFFRLAPWTVSPSQRTRMDATRSLPSSTSGTRNPWRTPCSCTRASDCLASTCVYRQGQGRHPSPAAPPPTTAPPPTAVPSTPQSSGTPTPATPHTNMAVGPTTTVLLLDQTRNSMNRSVVHGIGNTGQGRMSLRLGTSDPTHGTAARIRIKMSMVIDIPVTRHSTAQSPHKCTRVGAPSITTTTLTASMCADSAYSNSRISAWPLIDKMAVSIETTTACSHTSDPTAPEDDISSQLGLAMICRDSICCHGLWRHYLLPWFVETLSVAMVCGDIICCHGLWRQYLLPWFVETISIAMVYRDGSFRQLWF